MPIEVLFDLYITNEYGVETKVTDYINNYKEYRKVGMIYNICEFIIADFDLPRTLSQDGNLRIRVERNVNGTSYSDRYLIDELTVNHKGQIAIMGKTIGAKLFEPYMSPLSITHNFNTYNALFKELLGSIDSISFLSNIPNTTGFYVIENDTYGSVITSLAEKLGIDLYVKNANIILESIKTISASATPVISFTQKDGITASLTNKDKNGIGIISVNLLSSEVTSESSISLRLSHEPQPVRPHSTRTWTDPQTMDEYSIVPQTCNMTMFYNPLNAGTPKVNGINLYSKSGYYFVEEFELSDETDIELMGGILSIAGITITNGSESAYTSASSVQYFSGSAVADARQPDDTSYDDFYSLEEGATYEKGSDTLLFEAIPTGEDLSLDNGIKINFIESGVNQAISSALDGTGSTEDPYIYSIILGSLENIEAVNSSSNLEIRSMYSFSEVVEAIKLTSKDADSVLNGHIIKVDCTNAVQTSGYLHTPTETTFYINKNLKYDSLAKIIFYEIMNSSTLPFTATLVSVKEGIEVSTIPEVQEVGTLNGGVDEVYYAQRDMKAISAYVKADALANTLVTVSDSVDTSNPIEVPDLLELRGGTGQASSMSGGSISQPTFVKYHNKVCFEEPISGTVRIAYTTNVLVGTIQNSEYQKNIPIRATYIDSILKHIHEIRAIDYFPLSYTHRLDVSEEWSIEPIDSRYKGFVINKVDNYTGLETAISDVVSDSTGILMLHLGAFGYGQYSLNSGGLRPMYIRYYANKYDVSFDKIIIKEASAVEEEC